MKKLFYSIAIVLFVAISTISCTNEEVKPQSGGNSTGGGVSSPMF
jgi:hypothetical protein